MPPSAVFPLRHAAAAVLLALAAAGAPAQHAPAAAPARQAWDLPAAPLADTLARIARQSGRSLSADPALLSGRQSPAVRGDLSAEEAALQALAGSGLDLAVTPSGTLTVRPGAARSAPLAPAPASQEAADAPSLQPVQVNAEREQEDPFGPVRGLAARRSATATKTDTPVLETPQTLSVVPREQIELQAAPTVTAALGYTPGALAAFGGTNTQSDVIQTRGFYPREFLDGLRLPFSAYSVATLQFDPYMLERIELLQGPASVLFGQSTPGGVLNMVSRRPQAQAGHELQVQGGNFGRGQIAFDSTGPLDADGHLLYRINGLVRENDGLVDGSWEKRRMISPSFTWRPSANTSLTLLMHAQRDELAPQYQSLPAKGTLQPNIHGWLPRNRGSGQPGWDHITRSQHAIGYAFEHHIDATWTVRQNLRQTGVDVHSRAMPGVTLLPGDRQIGRVATESWAKGGIFAVDTQAQATFSTGAARHTLLLGLDHMRQRDDYRFASGAGTTLDLYAPAYAPALPPSLTQRLDTRLRMRQTGLYAQDQIRWNRWVFTAGLRHDSARSTTDDRMNRSVSRKDDKAWTGRVGVNYLFDNGLAPYASYSTSFEPLAGTDYAGTPFEPTRGKQVEVGVKYQPPGSQTLLTLAAYRLRQQNVLTPDPAPGHAGFSVQTGEVEVNGLSFEARTQLRRWDLIASYAYTDSEVTRANPSAAGSSLLGRPLPRTPRHQGSLWAGYRFGAGPLAGVTVGGGLRYLGVNYTDTGLAIRLPGLTLWDLAAHYDFPATSDFTRDLRLSLGISNVADKRYVSYCLNSVQCFYGQPRTVQVTLRKRW